jgi:hypothetical protein
MLMEEHAELLLAEKSTELAHLLVNLNSSK